MSHSRDTREEILLAAFQVFGEHGFDGTSIKLIARKAGIAPGSIYNHFKDKEHLFEFVVTKGWDDFLAAFDHIIKSEQSLEQKFETILDVGFEKLKLAQPLLQGMLFGANKRKLVQENIDRLLDHWDNIFLTCSPQGRLMLKPKERRVVVKYMIMGILLAVSLEDTKELNRLLIEIKKEIYLLFSAPGTKEA